MMDNLIKYTRLLIGNGKYFARIIFVYLLLFTRDPFTCELTVNLQNEGGEIFQESIWANTSADTVKIEHLSTNGFMISQMIDFRRYLQSFRVTILGEEELDEIPHRTICFLMSLDENDFIPSDAMAKLIQKNRGTIRQPDTDKGRKIYEMNLVLNSSEAASISPFLKEACQIDLLVPTNIYANHFDILAWTRMHQRIMNTIHPSSEIFSQLEPHPTRCNSHLKGPVSVDKHGTDSAWKHLNNLKSPCQCRLNLCIDWYPCSLKYCRNRDNGQTSTYRCGILSCKRCLELFFAVDHPYDCLWDD
ncbi:BRICHOS-like domain-containing protein out at first [Brevipalpus obovatus]|uniref:BRICHOS-like domain-containing protein out at first n=1 Tax=Brevipalpus obovatus TaxID=246614 RepID=UPI003D9DF041